MNSGATPAEAAAQKWMRTAKSENEDEADCLELVMIENNGIQDFLMQRANTVNSCLKEEIEDKLSSLQSVIQNMSATSHENINLAESLSPAKI